MLEIVKKMVLSLIIMMAPMKVLLFITTMYFLLSGLGRASHITEAIPLVPNPTDIEFKRYCSNTLAEAIHLICNGRTNPVVVQKLTEQVNYEDTDLTKRSASDEMFYRPLTNGPIHECCRRPCGYAELKQYCAPE